jgi:hypothetical protein
MPAEFHFDVFLSHSSKDKGVVRDIAERLRKDGLKVWFDEWEIKPGDSIPAKIEEGLENSRVMVICMSANAFGSDWAQLEGGTFRFRDPLNKERRFIPLRLDDTPIKGSLAQFLYIKWLLVSREQEYAKLLAACRAPTDWPIVAQASNEEISQPKIVYSSNRSEPLTREEVAFILRPLFDQNRVIWFQYGPDTDERFNPESDSSVIWRRKLREHIIPNNQLILQICDQNSASLTDDERSVVEVFRQHVLDLESKHLKGTKETGIRFPVDALTLFTGSNG